jgi:hypothetical protein
MDEASTRYSALISFRLLYGCYSRAIDEHAVEACPAEPGFPGHTINVDGIPYRLHEKEAGSLDARLQDEDALIKRDWNHGEHLRALVKALAAENDELRKLLGPVQETLLSVNRDPLTQELLSSRSIKKFL